MMKYNIAPTHPGALPYHEIVSPEGGLLRRDVSLGLIGASLSPDSQGYTSPVTVGEGDDAKTFELSFDTGSPLVWLFSDITDQSLNSTNSLYTPLNSTTATPTGEPFNITYGGGFNAFGILFNDTISIGDITIYDQTIGADFRASSSLCNPDICNFTLDGFQGLLGLSLDSNNDFLSNLFFGQSQHPTLPVFTTSLTRLDEPDGFFTFGYIEDQLVGNNTIQYTPVIEEVGGWVVTSPYAVINGFQIDTPGNQVLIDTGTTQILVPDELLPTIYEPLNGVYNVSLQSWVIPANFTNSQLPTIVLPVGEWNVTLAPQDILYTPVDEWIIGAIQSSGDSPLSIFGDFWLRNVYAIFNLGISGNNVNATFGFVPRAPNPVGPLSK
jgi:hypothetical protein